MKVVVLVKYVPDTAADRHFSADLTLDRNAVAGRLDEADEYAIEQALRIADQARGVGVDAGGDAGFEVSVTALTMGPAAAVAALRRALAMGADAGVHVLDDALHGSDALATSRVLAAAVRRLGFDLVVCGAASTDSGTALVPPMLADLLGVAVISHADALRVEGGPAGGADVVARREDEAAVEEVAAALPAVVSVTDRSDQPRYPKIRAIADARQKPLHAWSLAGLGVDSGQVGLDASATVVRMVIPHTRRRAGGVIRDDDRGGAAVGLADFLTERHFI